jgi:hypothetical protein
LEYRLNRGFCLGGRGRSLRVVCCGVVDCEQSEDQGQEWV